jgi:hypothetical protein
MAYSSVGEWPGMPLMAVIASHEQAEVLPRVDGFRTA